MGDGTEGLRPFFVRTERGDYVTLRIPTRAGVRNIVAGRNKRPVQGLTGSRRGVYHFRRFPHPTAFPRSLGHPDRINACFFHRAFAPACSRTGPVRSVSTFAY